MQIEQVLQQIQHHGRAAFDMAAVGENLRVQLAVQQRAAFAQPLVARF